MTIPPDTFLPDSPPFPCNIITFPSVSIPHCSSHLCYAPAIPFNCNVLGKLHHILCDAFPILHGPHCPFSYICLPKKNHQPTVSYFCIFHASVILSFPCIVSLQGLEDSQGHRCCFFQFSSVAQLCPTLYDSMDCSTLPSLSITNSWSLLNLMSIESVMPSNHLILYLLFLSVQFSRSVVSDSVTPLTTARQASLSITNSQSLPKPMSIESMMPSNHLILCHPLLLLPSIFPSMRVLSNELALCIR